MVATPVTTVVDLLRESTYSGSGSIEGVDLSWEWIYSCCGSILGVDLARWHFDILLLKEKRKTSPHTTHIHYTYFNYTLMVETPVITNVGRLWGVERRQHLLSLMLVHSGVERWQHLLSLMLLYSIWMNEVQVFTRIVFVHAYSDDRLLTVGYVVS